VACVAKRTKTGEMLWVSQKFDLGQKFITVCAPKGANWRASTYFQFALPLQTPGSPMSGPELGASPKMYLAAGINLARIRTSVTF
jgi:hypothetical protein